VMFRAAGIKHGKNKQELGTSGIAESRRKVGGPFLARYESRGGLRRILTAELFDST